MKIVLLRILSCRVIDDKNPIKIAVQGNFELKIEPTSALNIVFA